MPFFENTALSAQLMWVGAFACLTWLILSSVGFLLDRRKLFGENVWVKPLRFSSSLCLHYVTYAIVISWLSPAWQTNSFLISIATAAVLALFFQIGFIGIQAARAEPSHFNDKTPLMAKLELTMAVMAAIVTAPMAIVGVVVLADPGFQMSDAVRYATGSGFIVGTVMTFVSAYHLGMRQNPFFGDKVTPERRMPITDWSLDRGDLRPAHFFATHMMQATPLVGVLASYLFEQTLALSVALVFTGLWTFLAIYSYRLAVSGRSIISFWNSDISSEVDSSQTSQT